MLQLVSLLLATTSAVTAASLSFIQPSAASDNGGLLDYQIGEEISIKWTTPYEFTNLKVLQGPLANGEYTEMMLSCSSRATSTAE